MDDTVLFIVEHHQFPTSPSRPPSKPLLLSSSIPLKLPLSHHVALTAHSLCMISAHPKLNAVSSCISNRRPCLGHLHFLRSFFWHQKTITYIHSTLDILIIRHKYTRLIQVLLQVVSGVPRVWSLLVEGGTKQSGSGNSRMERARRDRKYITPNACKGI